MPSTTTREPATDTLEMMHRDVREGLSTTPKALPSKYFYDEQGSRLFDRITHLDAYYPTRTERGIMEAHIGAIAGAIGAGSVLIEYGSGSSEKTQLVLDALPDLAYYIPIDISAEHLAATAERLRVRYPDLDIRPLAADYTQSYTLPEDPEQRRKRVVYFPGSTIGNFTPEEAATFLDHMARITGPGGGLLLGIDRKKDRAVLERAYNDPEGVTAAFNLNLLRRLNRDLGTDFDLDAFRHRAFYNEAEGRIEMHLESLRDQTIHLDGEAFAFREGERIHTENSYKYDLDQITTLAARSGFRLLREWTDSEGWFSVLYFETDPAPGTPS